MSVPSAVKFYNSRATTPLDACDYNYVSYETLDDRGILYQRLTLADSDRFFDSMKVMIFVAPRSKRTVQDLIANSPGACRIIKYLN